MNCTVDTCTKEATKYTQLCQSHYQAEWRSKHYNPEKRVWYDMKNRCYLPTLKDYKDYGARGITVCDRWRYSFDNFLEDMGRRPSPKHTLDRKDVNGNYEPSNCRWVTWSVQATNRRNSGNIPGVHFNDKENLWIATLTTSGVKILQNAYKSEEEAVSARLSAEAIYLDK